MKDKAKIGRKSLKSKALKKKISKDLALNLAVQCSDSPLKKSYWNTFYCNQSIIVEDRKMHTVYCKNRWCLVCQSIKMADMAHKYSPVFQEFQDPYFVTLTAPTVLDWALSHNIKLFQSTWRAIMKLGVKQKRQLGGLRKSECTIRPRGYYHFHFHVLINGRANAEWLLEQWLQRMPNAESKGQDLQPVDPSRPLIDLFKYFTKLTTKVEASTEREFMPIKRLDTIFVALKGLRVFQPFGFVKPVKELTDYNEAPTAVVKEGVYRWVDSDWWDSLGISIADNIIVEIDEETNAI